MAEGHSSKEAREAFESAERGKQEVIPGNEHGEHASSHAAHLHTEGKVHTTPEGYGKQGREPGTLNEPPQQPRSLGRDPEKR